MMFPTPRNLSLNVPHSQLKPFVQDNFFRRIEAFGADAGFSLGDWEAGKLRHSLLFMIDDLYGDREGEKKYPAEWEDETTFKSFYEKTVSTWVKDLPDDEKACIERLADILGEKFTIDVDDEAGWEKHESRLD
ncbi:hypothetical protein FDENT_411 [Fusarium denticulatum]|uniref:Uncharacterized protein n=1 Tax=Fusarium denticulatum TaxID=48507 RepID=A0A8H5XKN2_9HYPO|nr:hypothetical protein FDENT_411 [Fusarium denticulatum]